MSRKSPIEILIEKCPTIINLVSKDKRFWRNQIKRHNHRQNHFLATSQDGSVHFPDTSFIDLAVRAANGEDDLGDLLNFIDKNLKTVLDNSPKSFESEFRQKVKSMISGFEYSRANFMDWAGEILVHALYLLESVEIVELENELPNKKRIDLKIKMGNEAPRLVEILNINLIGKEELTDVQLLDTVDSKISLKVQEKFIDLNIEEYNPFLQVVLWTSDSFIQKNNKVLMNYRNDLIEHQFAFLKAITNQKTRISVFEFGPLKAKTEDS